MLASSPHWKSVSLTVSSFWLFHLLRGKHQKEQKPNRTKAKSKNKKGKEMKITRLYLFYRNFLLYKFFSASIYLCFLFLFSSSNIVVIVLCVYGLFLFNICLFLIKIVRPISFVGMNFFVGWFVCLWGRASSWSIFNMYFF